MTIWDPQPLAAGQTIRWRMGPLTLWVQALPGEWRVATERDAEAEAVDVAPATPPEALDWKRVAGQVETPHVTLRPALPPRPVTVRPERPVTILPGQETAFFVGIPLWMQLTVHAGGKGPAAALLLCEYETARLSNTWYGLPIDGVLCYALRTRARTALDDIEPRPYRAVAPLRVVNEGPKPQPFERCCILTPHLPLFRGEQHFWTAAGTQVMRGENEPGQSRFLHDAPPFDQAGERIAAPREPQPHGVVFRTMDHLKSFARF